MGEGEVAPRRFEGSMSFRRALFFAREKGVDILRAGLIFSCVFILTRVAGSFGLRGGV